MSDESRNAANKFLERQKRIRSIQRETEIQNGLGRFKSKVWDRQPSKKQRRHQTKRALEEMLKNGNFDDEV